MVINVTGAEFETEVLKAEGSVLVDFWGITCQHCKALMPYVEELAAEKGDLKIVKVESKANRDLCVE
ncbi:MAG: thioredoxin, partial [Gracilibacteraceae bacterium]|nr:thioredoxin [Gracilibacteraceae bacterium]